MGMDAYTFVDEFGLPNKLANYINYHSSPEINFHKIKSERYGFYYGPNWSSTTFMKFTLLSGKYPKLLNLIDKNLEDLHLTGVAGETVYLSKSGKSALVCLDGLAVAHQFSNESWNAYDPSKGLEFPWIQNIMKQFDLKNLSTMPRISIVTNESHEGNQVSYSLSVMSEYGERYYGDSYIKDFLDYELLPNDNPKALNIRVWRGIAEKATVRELKIKMVWIKPSIKYKNYRMIDVFPQYTDVDYELKPQQRELVSRLIMEQNPYTTGYGILGNNEMLYKGDYIQVSKSHVVWVRVESVWVPLHKDAMAILEKEQPDSPLVAEYRVYKELVG